LPEEFDHVCDATLRSGDIKCRNLRREVREVAGNDGEITA
jgi:hypothetical protein